MPITEEVEETILIKGEFRHIHVQEIKVFRKDGVEVGRSLPHNRVILPDADTARESPDIKDISATVHTPAIKRKWETRKSEEKARYAGKNATAL